MSSTPGNKYAHLDFGRSILGTKKDPATTNRISNATDAQGANLTSINGSEMLTTIDGIISEETRDLDVGSAANTGIVIEGDESDSDPVKPKPKIKAKSSRISAKASVNSGSGAPTVSTSTPAGVGKAEGGRMAGMTSKDKMIISSDNDEGGPVRKPGVFNRKRGAEADVSNASILTESAGQESDEHEVAHGDGVNNLKPANRRASRSGKGVQKHRSKKAKQMVEKAELRDDEDKGGQDDADPPPFFGRNRTLKGAAGYNSNRIGDAPKSKVVPSPEIIDATEPTTSATNLTSSNKKLTASAARLTTPTTPTAAYTSLDNDNADEKFVAQTKATESRSASARALRVPKSSKLSSMNDQLAGAQATPSPKNVKNGKNHPVGIHNTDDQPKGRKVASKKTDRVIKPKVTETSLAAATTSAKAEKLRREHEKFESLEDDPQDPATSVVIGAAINVASDDDSEAEKDAAVSVPSSDETDSAAELASVEKQLAAQLELNSDLKSRHAALTAKLEKLKSQVQKAKSAGKGSKEGMALTIAENKEEMKEIKETLEYKTDQCKDLQESQKALEKCVKKFFEVGDRISDQRKIIAEMKAEGKAGPTGLSEKRKKALHTAEAAMAELRANLMDAGSVVKAMVGMEG